MKRKAVQIFGIVANYLAPVCVARCVLAFSVFSNDRHLKMVRGHRPFSASGQKIGQIKNEHGLMPQMVLPMTHRTYRMLMES